jgi:tripartite-type tricarboxylate transporter receptor subunit TctC
MNTLKERLMLRAMLRGFVVVLLAALSMTPQAGFAQTYPNRPVHLIIPFAPGGVSDVIARPIAERLSRTLGQPVVVESRAGASGTLGAAYVAQSTPDGYTLLLGTANEIAMAPTLYRSLPYDPRTSFAPISTVSEFPNVLVVGKDAPYKTLADLIAAARDKPDTITFANSGVGSTNHLSAELFKRAAKIEIQHVPYRGGGPALADLSGGHVTAMFATLPSAVSLIQGGVLRALAVTGPQRSAILPDVPSVAEAGLPDAVVTTWNGIMAPSGTPPEVLERLHKALAEATAEPSLKATFAAVGADTEFMTQQEFATLVRTDFDHWAAVIKQAGISAQQ